MLESKLHPLFEPRSVAVVGVSSDERGVGRRVFENLRSGGFSGQLYAVNPKQPRIGDVVAYANVEAIPDPIDLAVIAIPAAKVIGALRACGKRGTRFAIVLSAGFAETGERGLALQRDLLAEAKAQNIRIIGPNCLGVMRASSSLNASFSQGIGLRGKLALVSQSGAVCSAVLDWAQARQIGFSTVASLGAASDVGVGELLDHLALDPETEAILLYVEGVEHARSFMSGLRAAARLKPVIVVKSGRHPAGSRAATSHTGAIVGNDAVFDAALRRAGAVRVEQLPELFSAAEVLSHAPRVTGNRLAIITNAGGLGVLAVDRAEDLEVPLAELSEETRAALSALLPAHASHGNPIDVLGDAEPARYGEALDLCLADPGIDGVLVLLTPQVMTRPDAVASEIARREQTSRTPILTCFLGGAQVQAAREALVRQSVPCFDSPEAAVEAFASLARYHENQKQLLRVPGPSMHEAAPDLETARRIVNTSLDAGRKILSQLDSKAMLRAFHIECAPAFHASTLEEAATAAQKCGFPVALKIDSPDITHKSEVQGVWLGIQNAAELQAAYSKLLERVKAHAPKARIGGVIVEPMFHRKDGRELLVGVTRDPALGPAIAFGPGGTLVELIGGAAVALPPLDATLARDMIERSRATKWLGEFRGMQPADLHTIEQVLLRVSNLVCELPEVIELDINPLIANADGAVALDVRIVVERTPEQRAPYAHLAIAPYPHQHVRSFSTHDGREIMLRPIQPDDAEMETRFISSLSFQSKYFRFLTGLAKLSPEALVRFTQLDYDREMAFVATVQEQDSELELGVARYVADPDAQGCEMAVVVADAWQRKGIGKQLMTSLMDVAREQGLRRMYGEVLVENTAMLRLMASLDFQIAPHPEDHTLRLVTREL